MTRRTHWVPTAGQRNSPGGAGKEFGLRVWVAGVREAEELERLVVLDFAIEEDPSVIRGEAGHQARDRRSGEWRGVVPGGVLLHELPSSVSALLKDDAAAIRRPRVGKGCKPRGAKRVCTLQGASVAGKVCGKDACAACLKDEGDLPAARGADAADVVAWRRRKGSRRGEQSAGLKVHAHDGERLAGDDVGDG